MGAPWKAANMSLDARPPQPDRNKIDLSDDVVARHWSKKLGRTREEIAAAVAKVGDNCESVKKELGCKLTVGTMSND